MCFFEAGKYVQLSFYQNCFNSFIGICYKLKLDSLGHFFFWKFVHKYSYHNQLFEVNHKSTLKLLECKFICACRKHLKSFKTFFRHVTHVLIIGFLLMRTRRKFKVCEFSTCAESQFKLFRPKLRS